ncbi:hypothetical protein SPRG_03526 [Saprolegnia parasitica CBS 223.65]|uniref:EGF-like domain-containing protein n=1 Tax=Saprolegnia parasitica (strain CBS 223.65) TaxID=695850 RepID=A0A067CXS4_SAPPC|nr:hypothetical protein SPRG_03526 [Saprolegnia parasitica CBS 223.65]KDO31597.1 hypothetical protein SPRG_03526 [Saprolegnia parasitica CBS 223.65]|eukprot:XP_012197496.1 hypothetical protein SPRG_03526 [Saprolegnia parasitica CBS 223.65]
MRVLALVAAIALASAATTTKSPVPTLDRFNGVCSSDEECAKFPGTVCVFILSGDYSQGKCTPNYGTRPVCRGGQAGLCPSYQDPSAGYLNTQCVLIDKAMQPATDTDAIVPVATKNGSTPATVRFLLVAANETTEPPLASVSASGSGDGTVVRTPVKDQPCPTNPSLSLADPKCWFTTSYQNTTLTVQYKCVDYDMCLTQSAYSQESQKVKEAYCRPQGCVTGDKSLCNNRGTCQANSAIDVMLPRKYACRCYAGFTGTQCEKSDGTADCDVDCGQGGACIDNKCSCYKGYVGKNIRCDKCTSNDACENGNTCTIDTGKCDCKNGFNGPTCGGKLDICAGVTCSGGGYTSGASGKTCTCFCPKCPAGTTCTPCGGANGRDCSTCPASTLLSSGSVTPMVGLAALSTAVAMLL